VAGKEEGGNVRLPAKKARARPVRKGGRGKGGKEEIYPFSPEEKEKSKDLGRFTFPSSRRVKEKRGYVTALILRLKKRGKGNDLLSLSVKTEKSRRCSRVLRRSTFPPTIEKTWSIT